MYENLRAEVKKHNLSYEDLASISGTVRGTIMRRMSGMADFKLQEIWRIADYVNYQRLKSLAWGVKPQIA